MTVDIVEKYGPRSYAVGAGAIAIVPQGAWHRVHSANGRTVMSATLPGEHIDLDVDDPRTSTPGLDIPNTMGPPSALTQRDVAGRRSSLARMASADLVQRKGFGLALWSVR